MTQDVLGRGETVDRLADLVLGGAEVLLYGPLGIGKTAVLEAVLARARSTGVPCGRARRTGAIDDVVHALQEAYPSTRAPNRRRLRSRLRLCVEERPVVLPATWGCRASRSCPSQRESRKISLYDPLGPRRRLARTRP